MTSVLFKLRRFKDSDFKFVFELESDPEIVKFTPMKNPQTEEESKSRFNKQLKMQENLSPFGFWAAVDNNDELLAWTMLIQNKEFNGSEIGFMVRKKHQGRGLATAITKELILKAKDLKQDLVFARTNSENRASQKVLVKAGFKFDKEDLKTKYYVIKHLVIS